MHFETLMNNWRGYIGFQQWDRIIVCSILKMYVPDKHKESSYRLVFKAGYHKILSAYVWSLYINRTRYKYLLKSSGRERENPTLLIAIRGRTYLSDRDSCGIPNSWRSEDENSARKHIYLCKSNGNGKLIYLSFAVI